jgi:hypothetical protein
MAQFTTRVELHDAAWSDYVELHKQMRQQGFSQTITSGDGAIYELPPAEYYYVGDQTRADVLSKAKQAATAVKPSFAVVVTEAIAVTWHGLKLIKKAAA